MKGFRNRAAEKARRAASGGDGPPAGQDPVAPAAAPRASTADRGAMRKRLRRARHMRDAALHELGALVMEMHRQGRHDPALVERKAREAVAVDAEARALAGALDRGETLTSVSGAGILGPCGSCGTLLAREDRFCGRCGTPAGAASPNGNVLAAPPASADRVIAAPPSAADRVEAAPPSAADRVEAAPPSAADRVDAAPPSADDLVPTYTVTTR
jgi:hypothetical protein